MTSLIQLYLPEHTRMDGSGEPRYSPHFDLITPVRIIEILHAAPLVGCIFGSTVKTDVG